MHDIRNLEIEACCQLQWCTFFCVFTIKKVCRNSISLKSNIRIKFFIYKSECLILYMNDEDSVKKRGRGKGVMIKFTDPLT